MVPGNKVSAVMFCKQLLAYAVHVNFIGAIILSISMQYAELGTKYFLQMYLNAKYIDVLKYFCKYFFILFSK